jgi:hypothetical protein
MNARNRLAPEAGLPACTYPLHRAVRGKVWRKARLVTDPFASTNGPKPQAQLPALAGLAYMACWAPFSPKTLRFRPAKACVPFCYALPALL